MVLEYGLDLDFDSTLLAGQGDGLALTGRLVLQATLRLRVLASGGQGVHLGVDLPAVRSAHWTLAGEPVPQELARQEYLDGRQGVVLLEPDGRVTGLRFPADSPRPFANLLESLFRQAQAPVEPGRTTWSPVVEGAFGVTRGHFRVDTCDPRECRVTMSRTAGDYQRFFLVGPAFQFERGSGQGDQSFTVTADGVLSRVETRERVALVRSGQEVAVAALSARLVLRRRGWETPRPSSVMDQAWVQARDLPDRSRENALRTRAAGMTLQQLRADVLRYGNGGKVPRHERWLWQVTGLLKLQPELCEALADLFRDPSLEGAGKALVLDLLANTGHGPAQAVLRQLLSAEDVRARDDYPALVQRYLLVRQPDDASLDFLEARFRGQDGPDSRYAAVGALGAALERSAPRDPEGTLRRALSLRDGLRHSANATEQRALVTALGNAGLPEVQEEIVTQTRAPDTGVRAAAATALRKLHDPAATDRLLELTVSDADATVQDAALRSLAQHTPAAAQLASLATALAAAPLAEQNQRSLVHLLRDWSLRLPPGQVLPVVEALQRRGVSDRALGHELQDLEARLRQGP
jgi:HEAT repeat protein